MSGIIYKPIDQLIRLGLAVALITGSFMILAPFLIPLIWAVIIAVALWPLYLKTVNLLGGRQSLTATLYALLGVLILVIPSIWLMDSGVSGYQYLSAAFEEGNLTIPPPTDEVKAWPLIGERVFSSWDLASHNLRKFINTYSDQIQSIGGWFLEALAGLGLTIGQFLISIIIAGVLLAKAEMGHNTAEKVGRKLVGERSKDFVNLTTGTIRSVVQGVIGIAVIQAIASAILLFVSGVPLAGVWALVVLMLAIMQLPPLLVLGPIIVYAFAHMGTTGAVVFTIFALLISISDSLLKPLFLGRGVDIPMLVVLLGAIGGMIVAGILGLFIGAVVLALSYKLLIAWMDSETES